MLSHDAHAAINVQNPTLGAASLSDVPDELEVIPVHLTADDGAPSRGLLYRLKGSKPRAGIHMMHPRTDQSTNYNIVPLALAGFAVLGRAGRWPNNDVSTIHEILLLDVAAGVKFLRRLGCEKVILLGNSGGSSLAAFYQAQAQAPAGQRLINTPAGDPCDLNGFELLPADGLALIGPHIGQGVLMARMIDASVTEEGNVLAVDRSLDLYDPANGFRDPPASSKYHPEFLNRYRAAQLARVARLDAIARDHIERQRLASEGVRGGSSVSLAELRQAEAEPLMVIHRTAADPAFVDLSIEPDDRVIGSYFSRKPHLENFGPNGFARYITPRAWLSTWSANSSRARTVDNLALQDSPQLVVHYAGDCGARMSDVEAMHQHARASDKQFRTVGMTDHFGFKLNKDGSVGSRATEGTQAVIDWALERFDI